jgi:hypothetical protein
VAAPPALGDFGFRSAIVPGRSGAGATAALPPAPVRASLRCEQTDQKTLAVLANRDLDIRFAGYTQQSLPDRNRLLGGIESDLEYLLGSFELAYEPLELALLLFALPGRGTQFAWPLGSFVHKRRVGLPNCDHFRSSPSFRTGNVIDRPIWREAREGGITSTIRPRRRMATCLVD